MAPAAGPRRPIVVVAGEVCIQVDTVVADSVVGDPAAADFMVAAVGASVDKRTAKGEKEWIWRNGYVARETEQKRPWRVAVALDVLYAFCVDCHDNLV